MYRPLLTVALSTIALLMALVAPVDAQRCDVNDDGNTAASDALIVLRHAVGIPQAACNEPLPGCPTTTTTLPLPGDRSFERRVSGTGGGGIVTFDAFADSMVVQITIESGDLFFCNDPVQIIQDGVVYPIDDFLPNSNEIGISWVNHAGCGYIFAGVTATGTMDPPYPAGFDLARPFRIIMGIWAVDDFFDVGAL